MQKEERFFSLIIKPFRPLNHNPILYKGKNFHLVYFGLFMVISIFISNSLLLFYLNLKGIYFSHHVIIPLSIILLTMLFCTKFFHIFVVGLDYFKKPLKYMNQTVMYNQGGIFGAAVGIMIIFLIEKVRLIILMDAVTYGAMLSLFVGRLACYNYGCCYGQPTTSEFGVVYTHPLSKVLREKPELKNVPLHPTQLIASLFNLSLFLITSLFITFFSTDGVITIFFLISYNIFRYISQRKRDKANVKIIFKTAMLYLFIGITLLIISLFFKDTFYTVTNFSKPVTFWNYLIDIFLNGEYMLSMGLLSIIVFLFYGLHGKKLGQYF